MVKVTEHEAGVARRVLVGMVVDAAVLGRVADRWRDGGLFATGWTNLVGGWCVDYYRRYGRAPADHIEALFESWAAKANDPDAVDMVERFLDTLSDEYVADDNERNSDYIIDLAGEHFNAVALDRMAEVVKGHVARGEAAKAAAAWATYDKVELGVGAGVDVFEDEAAVTAAFTSSVEPLIKYPGAMGEFMSDQLARDEFVAVTGATGLGKTWWLQDFAWMGVKQGLKVAFFQVGDMSQNQMMRRFMCRNAGHPIKSPRGWPCTVRVPTQLLTNHGELADVVYEERDFTAPLDVAKAWAACRKRTRRRKTPQLRLSTHPNDSISVEGITSLINVWGRSGWVPDVVVVDYADILAIPGGYHHGDRDAINATWKHLRRLSQEKHCLVITATQGDAASYTATTISRGNFSDDRRKNDHVTAMLGINATDEEKEAGIFRLNWTKRREEAFVSTRCVTVAGALAVGRPHILSAW